MVRAALCACAVGAACGSSGGGACLGPGDASESGVTITVRGETLGYGEFVARMGRDCGPESVTIDGVMVAPTRVADATLSICLPDRASVGATVDLASLENLYVGGVLADGCRVARDLGAPAAGTLALPGFCADGEPFGVGVSGSATATLCPEDTTTTDKTMTFGGGVVLVPGFMVAR